MYYNNVHFVLSLFVFCFVFGPKVDFSMHVFCVSHKICMRVERCLAGKKKDIHILLKKKKKSLIHAHRWSCSGAILIIRLKKKKQLHTAGSHLNKWSGAFVFRRQEALLLRNFKVLCIIGESLKMTGRFGERKSVGACQGPIGPLGGLPRPGP